MISHLRVVGNEKFSKSVRTTLSKVIKIVRMEVGVVNY